MATCESADSTFCSALQVRCKDRVMQGYNLAHVISADKETDRCRNVRKTILVPAEHMLHMHTQPIKIFFRLFVFIHHGSLRLYTINISTEFLARHNQTMEY